MEREDPITSRLYLFGGDAAWNPEEWTSSDDRVRGGRSISHLEVLPPNDVARFWGNLDIKTLGGAGFASQRTIGEDRNWNVEEYDGIEIVTATTEKSEDKMYTFNMKNQLLPPDPDTGREQSTISYEFDFHAQNHKGPATMALYVPWKAFRASYRGREPRNAPKLDLKNVKRFGIMIRSFFGGQEGDFSLTFKSIAAVKVKSSFDEFEEFGPQSWNPEEGLRARPKQQKPQETQETAQTAQSAEYSKRMSPLGCDLEKQESSGDKKTPDGQTPSAARTAPSPYKVLYVVGALLLAFWVLHPGNCK